MSYKCKHPDYPQWDEIGGEEDEIRETEDEENEEEDLRKQKRRNNYFRYPIISDNIY